MGVVQLADELKVVIDRQVAEGRAASDAEFVAEAVRRYAAALDSDEDSIIKAADEGIAEIDAGRFELISGEEDFERLRSELRASIASGFKLP